MESRRIMGRLERSRRTHMAGIWNLLEVSPHFGHGRVRVLTHGVAGANMGKLRAFRNPGSEVTYQHVCKFCWFGQACQVSREEGLLPHLSWEEFQRIGSDVLKPLPPSPPPHWLQKIRYSKDGPTPKSKRLFRSIEFPRHILFFSYLLIWK